MASEIQNVRPGDVISSDLFNDLVDEVNRLGKDTAGKPAIVPHLFGLRLSEARKVIGDPQGGGVILKVGQVIDVVSATPDPDDPNYQERLVIGQLPPPGQRVAGGSKVDLLLAYPSDDRNEVPGTHRVIAGRNG